jgi:SAM-dependent methyltransferase
VRNRDRWSETKFVFKAGRLVASSDPENVGIASRLIVNLIASLYQTALQEHASGRLLDLGCGNVPLYAAYRDFVTDITCVDWDNSLHKNEYLDHSADLSQPLAFDDGAFDTIILSDVLEHIPVPLELCQEISRMLVPGGKLIMSVPFYYWLHEQPHDFYRYTEYALRRFMDLSGMQVIYLTPAGGALEVVSDILSKISLRYLKGGRFVAATLQRITQWFLSTAVGSRISRRTAVDFPLCYFMVAEKR